MKAFMDRDFLLSTDTAKVLFHNYAEQQPIIDYHNHLNPREIYERQRYENLTQLWLYHDHYKWRAMRANGVDERYVTGNASDWEKFYAYACTMPKLIGNPLYHWTHLELQRYFGVETPLNAETAEMIWNTCNAMLAQDGFDAVSLLDKMQVKVLCTTDDPLDSLEWHKRIGESGGYPFEVLPSFRPDRFLHIDNPIWKELMEKNGVSCWADLTKLLSNALDKFATCGCKVSDHGFLRFCYGTGDPEVVMQKVFTGVALSEAEIADYQGALLRFLAGEYKKRGMAMQLHLGPIRNNSPRLFASYGADAGGDSIGAVTDPFLLSAFLGDLEKSDCLPKTILYGLNPCDNAMLATMAINFGAQVRYGAAWWLQDTKRGISEQIDLLMETGALAATPGMLTDSRSFTSFVRHEYYRRILCEKLGTLVENGEYPNDLPALGAMVKQICYGNAKAFFQF